MLSLVKIFLNFAITGDNIFYFICTVQVDIMNISLISKNIQKIKALNFSLEKTRTVLSEIKFPSLADCFHSKNYVEPIKKQFNSLRELLRYARGRCIEPLKGKKPYEHLVIIDPKTKRVLGEYKGNSECISEGLAGLVTPKEAIIVHGHPTQIIKNGQKLAMPVSLNDAFSLGAKGRKGKVVYAFDEQGYFSLLRKKPDFKPLTPEQIKHYEKLYDSFIGRRFVKRIRKEKNVWEILKIAFSFLTKKGRQKILDKINTPTEELRRDIHDFWKKYANEMGFVYRTNFSYLK